MVQFIHRPHAPGIRRQGLEDRMSDYTDHMHEERNAQRALVLALAYPLGLLLLVLALFMWGAA